MSGKGGHKHRVNRQNLKQSQESGKARENVAKARAIFEAKGQAWDPLSNPAQMAAMSHAGRRLVQSREHISK